MAIVSAQSLEVDYITIHHHISPIFESIHPPVAASPRRLLDMSAEAALHIAVGSQGLLDVTCEVKVWVFFGSCFIDQG